MISLREKLNNLIRLRGQISYQELKNLVEGGYFGRKYRISNVERRLRNSESPDVEHIFGERGATVAYRWKGVPVQKVTYKVLDSYGRVEKVLTFVK